MLFHNREFYQNYDNVEDTYFPDEDATLALYQRVVRPDSSSNTVTITLPPVAQAKGLAFSIYAPNGATNTVTVQDQDESEDWTNLTLDADNEGALLISDGRKWIVLADDIT